MSSLGMRSPHVRLPLPGPVGMAYVDRLAVTECPAFTARRQRRAESSGAPNDPIVWVEASGVNVVDADGNLIMSCPAEQGCANGQCVAACAAAGASQGTVGCDFMVGTPSFFPGLGGIEIAEANQCDIAE